MSASHKGHGFTIIELLISIAIIGLLTALILPTLTTARERSRLVKWKGYSHGLRVDPALAAYYNFEEQDQSHDEVWNRATGDPLAISKGASDSTGALEPSERNAERRTAGSSRPTWTSNEGRWHGKGAMYFGGPSTRGYCRVDAWRGLDGANERTVATWVRIDPNATAFGFMKFVEWGQGWGGFKWEHAYLNWSWSPGFRVGIGSATRQARQIPEHRDGQWHFLACRVSDLDGNGQYQMKDVELFVDGQAITGPDLLQIGDQNTVIDTQTTVPLTIGADSSTTPWWFYYFQGHMDETAIWKTPVTTEDVLEMYEIGNPRNMQ